VPVPAGVGVTGQRGVDGSGGTGECGGLSLHAAAGSRRCSQPPLPSCAQPDAVHTPCRHPAGPPGTPPCKPTPHTPAGSKLRWHPPPPPPPTSGTHPRPTWLARTSLQGKGEGRLQLCLQYRAVENIAGEEIRRAKVRAGRPAGPRGRQGRGRVQGRRATAHVHCYADRYRKGRGMPPHISTAMLTAVARDGACHRTSSLLC